MINPFVLLAGLFEKKHDFSGSGSDTDVVMGRDPMRASECDRLDKRDFDDHTRRERERELICNKLGRKYQCQQPEPRPEPYKSRR